MKVYLQNLAPEGQTAALCVSCNILHHVKRQSHFTRAMQHMEPYKFASKDGNLYYTVDSLYLDFGYLELPLISRRKSDPCFNIDRHLTSGNKILWIGGKIAPQEQFLPFSTIVSTYISN